MHKTTRSLFAFMLLLVLLSTLTSTAVAAPPTPHAPTSSVWKRKWR